MKEEIIQSEYLYRGKIVQLRLDQVRLENNQLAPREVVEHHGAVAIVALDEKKRVLMVRQYRSGAQDELLEIPAGTLEKNEDPALCAERELKEETGYRAVRWKNLGHFYTSPGFCTEQMHLFFARQLKRGEASPEDDEFILAEWVSFKRALRMIERGEIIDGKTMVGLLRVAKLLKM